MKTPLFNNARGEAVNQHFMFKRKDGLWDEANILCSSREWARQVVIGRYAPIKFANRIN